MSIRPGLFAATRTTRMLRGAALLAVLGWAARDESARNPAAGKGGAATTASTVDSAANTDAEAESDALPLRPENSTSANPVHQAVEGSRYGVALAFVSDSGAAGNHYRVRLTETGTGRSWDAGVLPSGNHSPKLVRADTAGIVFYRYGDYGDNQPIKLFLDQATKKEFKQIGFPSHGGLDSISRSELAAAIGVPGMVADALKGKDPRPGPEESWDTYLPKALKDHPMPSSTYPEFARARPTRVADGYDSTSEIIEVPGPVYVDGSRIWFGKTFYDGEGASGVGDVGYFETTTSSYTFLRIPELVHWSVSTLVLDDQTLWIGRVVHPEGADYGGGVLRRNLTNGEVREFPIDGVVHRIKQWNGRVYVATENGAAVIEGDRVVARYIVEPDINGKLTLARIDP